MGELDSKIIVAVEEVVAGTNVTVDNTDPTKPIVSSTGTGGGAQVLNDLNDVTTGLPLTPTNADDGRILYYDIDTNQWISDDIANISNVVKDCKTSVATGTIAKGVPVYQAGYDNDLIVVEPCDASDPNKMPCIGVTAEVLDDTNAKKVVSFGKIQGVDTSAWADNTQLWVAPGGGFTTTRPTGATTQIQRVVRVLKGLDASGGQIKVFNTSRVAGLPNVSENHMWIGDANGHPIERNYIADIDNLQDQIDDLVPRNELISGFVEWSGVGFIYNVSALVYRIQGVVYTTAPTQITLDPADPTNDRIDVIYADINQLVGKITGTPDPAPVKPTVDSLTQIEVTFITIGAGTTIPNVTVELIYDENIEWTGTTNGLVNFASTNDFYTGTVSTEVTTPLSPNQEILYTAPAPYTIVNGSTLTFWMKFKSNMTGSSSVVYIGFFNGGSLVGNTVAIGGTTALTYGLDASNTVDWQLASIPLTEFGSLPSTVDAIKYFVPNLPGPPPPPAINFFLDKIEVQEGTVPPVAGNVSNWIPMFSGGLFATNQTFYSNWEEATAVQANVEVNFPASTLKAFKINCNTNNANNPTVIDVMRGASVLISLTIPGNTTGVYTATGSVPIAEDDLLCIRVTIPAGGPSIGLRGGLLNIEV